MSKNDYILISLKLPDTPFQINEINKLNIKDEDKINIKTKAKKHYNAIENLNVAAQISAAIAAYSRIFMINVMNDEEKKGNTILYTDTDSIISLKEINSTLIDPIQIGKFKLENFIEEAVFLAPKVYALKIKGK
jgi:hypothetical protein